MPSSFVRVPAAARSSISAGSVSRTTLRARKNALALNPLSWARSRQCTTRLRASSGVIPSSVTTAPVRTSLAFGRGERANGRQHSAPSSQTADDTANTATKSPLRSRSQPPRYGPPAWARAKATVTAPKADANWWAGLWSPT